jgi:hypothetical protein
MTVEIGGTKRQYEDSLGVVHHKLSSCKCIGAWYIGARGPSTRGPGTYDPVTLGHGTTSKKRCTNAVIVMALPLLLLPPNSISILDSLSYMMLIMLLSHSTVHIFKTCETFNISTGMCSMECTLLHIAASHSSRVLDVSGVNSNARPSRFTANIHSLGV